MSESIVISALLSLPLLLPRALRVGEIGSFAFIGFTFSWKNVYIPLGIIRRRQHVAVNRGYGMHKYIIIIKMKDTC